jgi:hypothetical protein
VQILKAQKWADDLTVFFCTFGIWVCESCLLVKMIPSVNFNNILQAAFSKVFCAAFFYLQFGFLIFWQKKVVAKAAHKMLVKSATGVNFKTKQSLFYPKSFTIMKNITFF